MKLTEQQIDAAIDAYDKTWCAADRGYNNKALAIEAAINAALALPGDGSEQFVPDLAAELRLHEHPCKEATGVPAVAPVPPDSNKPMVVCVSPTSRAAMERRAQEGGGVSDTVRDELMRVLTEYEGALQEGDEELIAPAREALLDVLTPIRMRIESDYAPVPQDGDERARFVAWHKDRFGWYGEDVDACKDRFAIWQAALASNKAAAVAVGEPVAAGNWRTGVEAVAKTLDKKADDYALEYGTDDMGALSFGSGRHADAKLEYHSTLIELAEEIRAMVAPDSIASASEAFQSRVQPWMLACFGAEIAADKMERNHRFFEESTETVQANGMTRSEAHQLVDYVYDRPVGELHQEVGGVMVTLAALCLASGIDMHEAGEVELARVWTKIEKIRAKQAAKPKHSPLPEHTHPAAAQPSRAEVLREVAEFLANRGLHATSKVILDLKDKP